MNCDCMKAVKIMENKVPRPIFPPLLSDHRRANGHTITDLSVIVLNVLLTCETTAITSVVSGYCAEYRKPKGRA